MREGSCLSWDSGKTHKKVQELVCVVGGVPGSRTAGRLSAHQKLQETTSVGILLKKEERSTRMLQLNQKSVTEGYALYDSIYVTCPGQANPQRQKTD